MKPIIETDRLLLREIVPADKKDMLRMYSDEEVHRYTGEPTIESLEEMEKAILERVPNYKKYGYGRWATILKEDMRFIGWAGLAYLPEFDEIDLGYRFMPQYWGKGYATEASQAVLDYGFEQLKLPKIIAIAMKENKASIRVMEKVGMVFDKYAPYDPGGEDVVWYKLER
jgi:RimJ/RimL family protein N-acetyltransferase